VFGWWLAGYSPNGRQTKMETSASLLESLRSPGADDAWQTLWDLYSPMLRRWLNRHGTSPSDSEDLIQEVLVVVHRRIGDFERQPRTGAFRSWLKTITVNCLRDHWKKKSRRAQSPGGSDFAAAIEQLADPRSGVSHLWEKEYNDHLTHFLLSRVRGQVSENNWAAFQRFALDGLSADQVAAELGMTPNAVFIAKSRVMACLRELGRGLID
jgi:RNA polymerase sigma factor (sigma-70 family)